MMVNLLNFKTSSWDFFTNCLLLNSIIVSLKCNHIITLTASTGIRATLNALFCTLHITQYHVGLVGSKIQNVFMRHPLFSFTHLAGLRLITLSLWQGGKSLAWDVTVVSTLAQSHVDRAATAGVGRVAELEAEQ